MTSDLSNELYQNVIKERPGRIDYTTKAFNMLPKMDKPNILDIGCGTGEPTIELAKLSNGKVTGVDINSDSLKKLEVKIQEQNLSDIIKTIYMSMTDLDFPKESFDLIWSEGSIFAIGFEKGLQEWKKFIKPKGFLVVHEMCWLAQDPPDEILIHYKKMYSGITTHEKNLEVIPKCGYRILGEFKLPENTWGELYFGPLEERIEEFKKKYKDEPNAIALIKKEENEIALYRKYKKWYGSAYYVMQKNDHNK
jgi:ubiquinone/menaquinone biosynthesis C-methylase UbiE